MEKKTLAIAMAAGILLKARNKDMRLTQVVTSLILRRIISNGKFLSFYLLFKLRNMNFFFRAFL